MKIQPLLCTVLLTLWSMIANANYGPATEVQVNYYDNIDITVRIPDIVDIYDAPELTELECLALNIYFEARGESRLGKELVAQVTVNRKRFVGWDNTICEVVRANRQFSWTHDGKSDRPVNIVAYGEAFEIAIDYLIEGAVANYPHAEILTNFHAVRTLPSQWQPFVEYVGKVGRHRFYKPSTLVYAKVTGI